MTTTIHSAEQSASQRSPAEIEAHTLSKSIVASILAFANKNGGDWPANAQWKIHFAVQAWPTEVKYETEYFTSEAEVKSWLRAWQEFAHLEDNHFNILAVFTWDLGPEPDNEIIPRLQEQLRTMKKFS